MLQPLRHVLQSSIVHPRLTLVRGFHQDYNAILEEQTHKLSDGRILGFAEYGDMTGTPAIFLHGSPGSRYDGAWYIDIAKKLNMRIICPERPGYGLSSFTPHQKLVDYPDDISQLARYLGLSKYHVFGISGGGPFAVACAYRLPKDELLSAAVIAGQGAPGSLTFKNEGLYTTYVKYLVRWAPNLLRKITSRIAADDEKLRKSLIDARKWLPKEDQEAMSTPKAEAFIFATFKAAYSQGTDGAIRDCEIYDSPWEFELKDVQNKVRLFYGHKDTRTRPAFGRFYKEHLANAELFEFEDMSHFNTDKYDEEMFSTIIGRIRRPPSALPLP